MDQDQIPTNAPGEVSHPETSLAVALRKLSDAHRHVCPRQVLGARMGLCAGEMLGLELPRTDKRLFVFVETDGCLADAVSAATGCTFGHRTMRLIDHGKTAATFVDVPSGRAVRLRPHEQARTRAARYAPDAPSRWHAQRAAYERMPAAELLSADRVELLLDLAAIVSRPGIRVACDRCHEEIVNCREVVIADKSVCRSCAGDRYTRPIGD